MNLIIPMAGIGSRLFPLTKTCPKPLLPVAGKPMICHILDKILASGLKIDKVGFITGTMEEQIHAFMDQHYSLESFFFRQEELLGPADAVYKARDLLDGETLVVFADTIFDLDFSVIQREASADGFIWVYPVDDPSRFGVVVEKDSWITELVEKPDTYISNLAQVGIYYFREGQKLRSAIETMIEQGIKRKNEYYLPPAFDLMLKDGLGLKAPRVTGWYDCGTVDALLDTNRVLLDQSKGNKTSHPGCIIREPVFIGEGAKLKNSILGPHLSIDAGVTIENSIVSQSIISKEAIIKDTVLEHSLVGEKAQVASVSSRLVVGDYSQTTT